MNCFLRSLSSSLALKMRMTSSFSSRSAFVSSAENSISAMIFSASLSHSMSKSPRRGMYPASSAPGSCFISSSRGGSTFASYPGSLRARRSTNSLRIAAASALEHPLAVVCRTYDTSERYHRSRPTSSPIRVPGGRYGWGHNASAAASAPAPSSRSVGTTRNRVFRNPGASVSSSAKDAAALRRGRFRAATPATLPSPSEDSAAPPPPPGLLPLVSSSLSSSLVPSGTRV
mmetsp:Transcript_40956/g.70028  ORF Transcript_40956/g.70028 Transcript_40956/m.70028 type:complete len:230 (-) Transcript_40956:98-787(-)